LITNPVKLIKTFVNKTFLVFSCILFLIIALSAIAAYTISAHQINLSFIEQQLSISSETMRLRLTTSVNSELALVLKMADTPIIRQHFMNPYDPIIKSLAYTELELYEEHFENKVVFWVSDVDKIFYTTGNAPYIINPDDPASYWYNLTLYETEKFNFNINYNPDLDQINLWVNVPVFADAHDNSHPIGMLGIGINLTDFSNFVASSYREFDENITPYMFNKYNEITSAADYNLVENKIHLDDLLGETGKELIRVAQGLSDGESRSFIYNKKIYLVNSIPSMEWYLAVSYPLPGLLALNKAMNTVFFSMLFLIFLMFIVINFYIARSERAMTKHNMQLLEAHRKAELASRAKSDFLAKMSHEIRTPMNAITGMAELLLRSSISGDARGHAQDIKQAGNNLVTIINDILDFSKIEAGKMEIIPGKYMLSSLINDTVNIIRTRIMEKPIRFFTNIDGNIPNNLIGDEVRLRQILINLLSNAVKYSEKGYIGLTITADKWEGGQVWLKIAVADTGKGIKKEDQAKLFDEFVKVDTKKNQGIEGTGLGLAITKRLCMAMGGDIDMESEYGKGSVFTALIPQSIGSPEPFAVVEEPEKKKVLVYEGRLNYAKSVCWTLENMRVPYTMVTTPDDFAAALYREEWFYIFSSYGLYEEIKPLMEKDSSNFSGGKKPSLALMIEWGTEAYIPGVRFVSIPVQSLSIANALNGKADTKDYVKNSGVIRFTYPSARILVVDDIATNLKVVEGLLAPYRVTVDTCLNGLQAIELVKRSVSEKRDYDIVFMDHMMPEMDGIEATAAIRAWEKEQNASFTESETRSNNRNLHKQIPIIALTANAVVGMREMFIGNGFNDFISKPIDVSKLDEMLDRWIPREKKEKSSASPLRQAHVAADGNAPENTEENALLSIPNVDTAKGIAMTGGTLDAYKQVLKIFCKDVEDRLPLLHTIPVAETLPEFATQFHALKSASASLGASEISAQAAKLEAASKDADIIFIYEHLLVFVHDIIELAHNIKEVLEHSEPENNSDSSSPAFHSPLFEELAEALKKKNSADIDRIIAALGEEPLDSKTKTALEKISDEVLMTEFDNAIKIINGLISAQN
jgi:signal transduction histidine kinase/DNA-binding response OmpR family regulator/HPt (histidine-containing phosphotransfer) domain-containing protein